MLQKQQKNQTHMFDKMTNMKDGKKFGTLRKQLSTNNCNCRQDCIIAIKEYLKKSLLTDAYILVNLME